MMPVTLQKSPLTLSASAALTARALWMTAPEVGRPIADAEISRSLRLAQSTASRAGELCADVPWTADSRSVAPTAAPARRTTAAHRRIRVVIEGVIGSYLTGRPSADGVELQAGDVVEIGRVQGPECCTMLEGTCSNRDVALSD